MNVHPHLIAGTWRAPARPEETFQAENPATRQVLPEAFPTATRDELEEAVAAGTRAADRLRTLPPEARARFLETYADRIEAERETLSRAAEEETGLPADPRFAGVEIPRTTAQLRAAAQAARDRSWARATIDTAVNIRSCYAPLGGPVVVFGPSNFPFAFHGIAGGDFAAAVAAGNPVIAKAHEGHPGTSKRLAELAHEAAGETGLPPGTVQMFYRCAPEHGLALVGHPDVGATAFTGSRRAGLALKAAADKAGRPIYLELGSINPVVFLPGALRERGREVAEELFASCALGSGQFCTSPGLSTTVGSKETDRFLGALEQRFRAASPGTLFGSRSVEHLREAVRTLTGAGAELVAGGRPADQAGYAFEPTLLRVSARDFLANAAVLQTEAFGAVHLAVVAGGTDELEAVLEALEGSLTGSIYSAEDGGDDAIYDRVEPILRKKAGRLLNDKMPTGVAVVAGMHHGGPYPASGHPGFTAVGLPWSMTRFAALQCYDNVRPERLPPELAAKNPTGTMWRYIDGTWSQDDAAD